MAAKKLTELAIDRMSSPAKGQVEVWDTLLPGFGLRMGTRAKSFIVLYRFKGQKRRLTLGRYPDLKLKDAREQAEAVFRKAAAGDDPEQEPAPPLVTPLVKDLVETFIERRVKPNRKDWGEVQRALKFDFGRRFGDRPLASLTRRDISSLIDEIVDRGAPVHANRVLTMIKTFCSWALEHEHITASPAASISRPTREHPRECVLSAGELARIFQACNVLGYPFGPLFQLLILTAQRRDEVAEMRWSEIDLEQSCWTLPSARTKTSSEHQIHLAHAAVEIIKALPGGSALLFTKTGKTATSGWSRAKDRLDRLLMAPGKEIGPPPPLPHWTLHDLRRSAATGMAEMGVAPHVVDKILNHVQGTIQGVAAIYNRHPYLAERREALDAWAKHVLSHV